MNFHNLINTIKLVNFMKKIFFKLDRIIALVFIYISLCGFTFDEDVLTKCEVKHPNDFIARIVCNGNVVKENERLLCAEKNEKYLEKELTELYSILDANYPSKIHTIAEIVNKKYNITSSIVNDSRDPLRSILVFSIGLKCEKPDHYIVNMYEDKNNIIRAMRLWKENKKDPGKYDERIFSYDWDYKLTKEKLDKCIDSIGYISSSEYCSSINTIHANNLYFIVSKFVAENKYIFEYDNYDKKKFDVDFSNFQFNLIKLINSKIDSYSIITDKKFNELTLTFNSNFKDSIYFNDMFYLKISNEGDRIKIIMNPPKLEKNRQTITFPIVITQAKVEIDNNKNIISEKQSNDNYFVKLVLPILIAIFFLLFKYIIYLKKDKAVKPVIFNNDEIKNTHSFRSKFFLKRNPFTEKKEIIYFENNEVILKQKISTNEFESEEYKNIFKAKYPFVSIYVPLNKQYQFIKECEWLEKKLGHFPSELEQLSILKSLSIDD